MTNYLSDIDPAFIKVERAGWGDRVSVEQRIVGTYYDYLERELGNAFINPDFSAANVHEIFTNAIDTHAPYVLTSALETEAVQYVFDEDSLADKRPLTARLGGAAVASNVAADLQPRPEFLDGLKQSIINDPVDFAGLQEIHDGIPPKVLELAGHIRDFDKTNPKWIDEAYQLLEAFMDDPEAGVFAPENNEALYGLCFFPYAARALTRRAIVGQTVMARMHSEICDPDPDESAMLALLEQFYKGSALSGQQWTTHGSPSEQTMQRISRESTSGFIAANGIRDLLAANKATRVVETWRRLTDDRGDDSLNAGVDAADLRAYKDGYSKWALSDVGHCFEGFRPLNLSLSYPKERLPHHEQRIEKDGTIAVIFEDDPEQMELWKGMVGDHSKYVTSSAYCHDNIAGVMAQATNKDVELFVLDIQNGDDDTAGIRIGDELIRIRLGMHNDHPELRTTIVVWSNSLSSVAQAISHFEPILESIPSDLPVSYMLEGSGRHIGRPVRNVIIKKKGWDRQI